MVLYTALYMVRTQVYLTEAQRRDLDRLAEAEGLTLAEVIRRAIDTYVRRQPKRPDPQDILDESFGSIPDLDVPSRSEWDRAF